MQAAVLYCRVFCDSPQGECLYSPDCVMATLVFDSVGPAVSPCCLTPAAASSGEISVPCLCPGLGELRFRIVSALSGVVYLACEARISQIRIPKVRIIATKSSIFFLFICLFYFSKSVPVYSEGPSTRGIFLSSNLSTPRGAPCVSWSFCSLFLPSCLL